MVVLVLVGAVCIVAGSLAAAAVHVAPRSDPALSATRAIGEQVGRRRSLKGFLDSRFERGVATGLTLTICLLAAIAAGIGILIHMVRTQTGLVQVDRAVEGWIGGLLLGWTWVALCAVAFGGRVMRFAAPVHAAAASEPEPRFDDAIAGAGLSPGQRKEIP